MRDERELLSIESTLKICRNYAEREATLDHPLGAPPLGRDRIDRTLYQSLFRRCMKHYGWELRKVEPEAETSEPPAAPEPAAL